MIIKKNKINSDDKYLPIQCVSQKLINTIRARSDCNSNRNSIIITSNIDEWTCYSEIRQQYLNNNESIGKYQNENLLINTETQSNYIQDSIEQQNQSLFSSDLSEQSNQSSINLCIMITNGNVRQEHQAQFNQETSLEEIAQFVLNFCQLTENVNPPFVSLNIYNQAYNDVIKRSKSLSQLSIKNNSRIDAIINQQGNKSR